MIWTLVVLMILIASVIVLIVADEYYHEEIHTYAILSAVTASLILAAMLCTILYEHTNYDGKIAYLNAEREAIVYQMNHNMYLGDSLGDFNKKVIKWRHIHNNPWTSWFQGPYIFEVDPIDLTESTVRLI